MIAQTVLGKQNTPGADFIEKLGLSTNRPLIVYMGGAAKLKPRDALNLEKQLTEGLTEAAVKLNANVVDGGTHSGTLGILNDSLGKQDLTGSYIGIAPAALVQIPGNDAQSDQTPLGPNHTHFILTEGENWGDELENMYALINTLAEGNPSIGVLANGGIGAQREVIKNVEVGRPVVLLSGSGRLADKLVLALRMPAIKHEPEVAKLAQNGKFIVFNINRPPEDLTNLLIENLQPG